jgi:hypothetical protein
MPKRKRQPDAFDVVEFLRESDDDLKSALNSLLRAPEAPESVAVILESEANLIPAPNLSELPSSAGAAPLNLMPEANVDPPLKLGVRGQGPGARDQESGISAASINIDPGIKLGRRPEPGKRQFAIREMRRAEDAHTRAEQHVYQCLWENATAYDEVSRTITIGFGAMAKLVGLSESNARINLRSLIAKLAVEEIAQYNCERSVGRTYRVFSEAEILRRRREAGLVWFMRRTLAVVFVDPATGQPLLKRKPLLRQDRALN